LPLPADPGAHEIAASAPSFASFRQTVTAEEGKTSDVVIALAELPKRDASPSAGDAQAKRGVPVWAWAAGGAGVARGVAAVGSRVAWAPTAGKQGAAGCGPDLQGCPRSYGSLADDNAQKNRDRALFYGLGVGSIVGVGAGIVGIVTGVTRKSEPRAA